ncbi:hypothetical protein QTP70_002219 [Hemibagrus guttatus]|uniref:Uncharacterized protein n=1 Tax=Hemibagrus guttatus TaxID=175788 RepID=A0AAE0QXH0_9TELE|nr:hypothetical protein QTP70_002219 [Hemibagrus guttatus]
MAVVVNPGLDRSDRLLGFDRAGERARPRGRSRPCPGEGASTRGRAETDTPISRIFHTLFGFPSQTMASYVDNSFRQAVMLNPAERTQQRRCILRFSLWSFRLDYCSFLLAGLPLKAIRTLQMIQNAAARIVFNLPKFSHITTLLRSLHWLPVAARIRFKTLMLAYKAKNGPAPSYLKALITPHAAPRSLQSPSNYTGPTITQGTYLEADLNPMGLYYTAK